MFGVLIFYPTYFCSGSSGRFRHALWSTVLKAGFFSYLFTSVGRIFLVYIFCRKANEKLLAKRELETLNRTSVRLTLQLRIINWQPLTHKNKYSVALNYWYQLASIFLLACPKVSWILTVSTPRNKYRYVRIPSLKGNPALFLEAWDLVLLGGDGFSFTRQRERRSSYFLLLLPLLLL